MQRMTGLAACLLGVLVSVVVSARGASPPQSAASELAAARGILAAGRLEEALERIDGVLKRDPVNREAVAVKVTALLGPGRFADALGAYDAYAAAANRQDTALLAEIGRADLKHIIRQPPDTPTLAAALERLARDGDGEARDALRRASAGAASRDAVALNVGLARLGEQDAVRRLGDLLDSASTPIARAEVIRALQDAGIRSLAPKVAALLTDGEPLVRSAAALAVGALQFADAVPRLEVIFKEDAHIVRMHAAVALKRLGRNTADVYLAQMLGNETAEVRLIAAEAYQTAKTTQWVPWVRTVLSDRNDLNRLRAAELLACCDQPAARSALSAMLKSDNPFLRGDAARILEGTGLADASMARRMLGDSLASVRLHGAGVALTLDGRRPQPGRIVPAPAARQTRAPSVAPPSRAAIQNAPAATM